MHKLVLNQLEKYNCSSNGLLCVVFSRTVYDLELIFREHLKPPHNLKKKMEVEDMNKVMLLCGLTIPVGYWDWLCIQRKDSQSILRMNFRS